MRQYVLKRLFLAVPTLLLVSVIVFSLTRLLHGDVVVLMFEEKAYAEDLEAMRAKLGLTRPIHVQYGIWLGKLAQGDLGESFPGFWKATLIIVFSSIWFGWAPPLQFTPFTQNPWQHISQFLLPAFLLAIASSAGTMRLTRALMLEVLRQDYIRTAWSKGMRERRVVVKHALKNAIIPVITIIGIEIGQVASGTVIFETIFGLPGMGRFFVDAIFQRDYPVVQGVILLAASLFVVLNLLVDMTYAYLDPRIRYQ